MVLKRVKKQANNDKDLSLSAPGGKDDFILSNSPEPSVPFVPFDGDVLLNVKVLKCSAL